jgi:hypothetical protein
MKRLARWFKKYFIPHTENEFKPHFLRHESMMLFFTLVIIVELGFLVQVFIVFDKTNFLASVLPGVLTTMTNEERAQNNVPPLTQNDLLTKAANLKAQDMATYGYFAHTSPQGKTPWYWFDQVGYSYIMAGENLAVNFFESSDVAQAWMDSPTHRANVVKKDYREIGIGVANGVYEGKNTVFVAELFGTSIENVPVTPLKEIKNTTTPTPVKVKTPAVNSTVTSPVVAVIPIATQILGEATKTTIAQAKNNETLSYIRSFIQKVLTSPRQYLTYVYGGIAILILLALLLALFVKSEIRHPAIMLRGLALVTVIVLLLFININILNRKTTVETFDLTANTISSIAY